jgi:hypothetical protein
MCLFIEDWQHQTEKLYNSKESGLIVWPMEKLNNALKEGTSILPVIFSIAVQLNHANTSLLI